MLRCLVFGCPGTPIYEIAERISEFHKLSFHTIEIEPLGASSYFDDKIPSIPFDTGDFSSGSSQESMVRDPQSSQKDKELDKPFRIDSIYAEDSLDPEELSAIFCVKQGVVCTEIPGKELVRWANKVVYVYTDENFAMNWYKDRRKCPSCGNVHHLQEKPPRHDNICDRCGTDLKIGRASCRERV